MKDKIDDIDGNYKPEAIYNGQYRSLSICEESMFSEDFNLVQETSHVLKHIESSLRDMKHNYEWRRMTHQRVNEMCSELIEIVMELRRYYPDDNYDG